MAELVWSRLGDVDNYIEPFMGSAAVLLARPHPPRIETVNDADCMVANFWRATKEQPERVAEYADNPVNEADMHATHRWLVLGENAERFRHQMRTDPDYYDARVAGRWAWGLCSWIGGGWCAGKSEKENPTEWNQTPKEASGVSGVAVLRQKMPTAEQCRTGGKGVNGVGLSPGRRAAIGQDGWGLNAGRPQLADAFDIGRGVNSNGTLGTCEARRAWLLDWFGRLRDRLRLTRVCCGDWLRVCSSDSVTVRLGLTGIFFDPPYSTEADRDNNLYAVECGEVAHKVRAYCLERGGDRRYRICLAGYDGEHNELVDAGWHVEEWAAQGGYGNRSAKGKANAKRERLWFSPHCITPDTVPTLF